MLGRLGHLGKHRGKPIGMQNRRQLLQHERIPFGLLQGDGFVEQVALTQVCQDKIEQVDMTDTETGSVFRHVIQEERDMLTDTQFSFRRIIENVKGNLVAQPFAPQKGIRGNGRQNLIQSLRESIVHEVTCMQRSTYCSWCDVRYSSTGAA